ncbi:MAG: 16S rRNA (uracil(1498)-N(3))-methyltransferase, partial [Balneolaceae bacterium]|nr:16S rRNA (uracil(1498)-N(3))-methyltransferase [Balneolaceae bacterium]
VLKPDELSPFDRVVLADETVNDAVDDSKINNRHPARSSLANPTRILVFIGPEGGISARERELLGSLAMDSIPRIETISLGANRLRAETAAISALLHLQLAPH